MKKEAKGGAKSAMASRVVRMLKDDPPPDVEWWDALLLGTPNRQVEESSAMEDTNGTTEENGDVAMEEGEEKKDKVLDMGDTTTFASTSTRYSMILCDLRPSYLAFSFFSGKEETASL